MKESPLAPQPGQGMETAVLEKAPSPEPEEAAALDRVWGHLPADARRGRRDLLLPALIALQEARGWISYPALAAVCLELTVPLADAFGVASFYGLLSTEPGPKTTIYVCDDVACRLRGAEQLAQRLEQLLGPSRQARAVDRDRNGTDPVAAQAVLGWAVSSCLGQCDRAPAVLFGQENIGPVTADGLTTRVEAALAGEPWVTNEDVASAHVGTLDLAAPVLLQRAMTGEVQNVARYIQQGGYEGLRRALAIGPEATIEEVRRARLVGRGGAAFPTAIKWDAVAKGDGERFVVCNADESEPGTFKDRILLERDPFAVLEGMTISAFATGAQKGFIYLRGEYTEARAVLENALAQARDYGYLGSRVLGGDFDFDVELRLGAGAYVCGEETALFNSLEGYRGEPRPRPPFPTEAGLFGRPTVINNVETLASVPPIVLRGGDWYAGMGTDGSTGTKLVSISGHVAKPGVYEVPFGVSVRRIIDEAGGGVPGGRPIRAVLCGGAAGTFLTPQELDTPLAFETLRAIGGTVGSGALVVYDEGADLWDAVERITRFFMDESCGQCVPCRVGTRRQWEWVRVQRGAAHGNGVAGGTPKTPPDPVRADAMLADLAAVMQDASICGLGQLAPNALLSALRLLRADVSETKGGAGR